jgi:hypothetical protein
VGKNISAAICWSDKAKAFRVVKPFNGSCCHNNYLIKVLKIKRVTNLTRKSTGETKENF